MSVSHQGHSLKFRQVDSTITHHLPQINLTSTTKKHEMELWGKLSDVLGKEIASAFLLDICVTCKPALPTLFGTQDELMHCRNEPLEMVWAGMGNCHAINGSLTGNWYWNCSLCEQQPVYTCIVMLKWNWNWLHVLYSICIGLSFPPLSCRPDRGADKRMDFSSDWEGQNSPPRNTAGVSSLPVWLCNHSSSQSMRLILHAKWWCYIVRVWRYTRERSGTLVSQETICIGNSLHIPRSFHSIFCFHSRLSMSP